MALALEAVALDLGLASLEVLLPVTNLFLGPAELDGRRRLGVPLDRVGELGGRTDQVERVHPDRMTRRLDGRAAPGSLDDPELCLQLCHVPPEGLEGFTNAFGVEPVPASRDVFERR